jgi:2,3-diaminopropionate biosynthesis protein SbnB
MSTATRAELSDEIASLSRAGDLVVLTAEDVIALLASKEEEIMQAVKQTYLAHDKNLDCLPHSVFLHHPRTESPADRIIALPAYLQDQSPIAGIKWISSYPGNIQNGLERASAAIILNSTVNGRPVALLEGSVISARRTAASAALAAKYLVTGHSPTVSFIGCGVINYEILRFLCAACGPVQELVLYDLDRARVDSFGQRSLETLGIHRYRIASSIEDALRESRLISFATTAGQPHVNDLSCCQEGSVILQISLRDLHPDLITRNENIVDDIDHVCRANTSVHLAEIKTGDRSFIRGTIAQVITGAIPSRQNPKGLVIFSPFGLGTLDLAVSRLCVALALERGNVSRIRNFLPA